MLVLNRLTTTLDISERPLRVDSTISRKPIAGTRCIIVLSCRYTPHT